MDCRADDVLDEGYWSEGLRWLILRGPIGTPCAYVGIPERSPAAGLDYEVLDEQAPSVHGGWTFSAPGDGKNRPMGWYWWGWDYAHFNDWTLDEVVQEVRQLLPQFDTWLRGAAPALEASR